jgi:hypothetical protein
VKEALASPLTRPVERQVSARTPPPQVMTRLLAVLVSGAGSTMSV